MFALVWSHSNTSSPTPTQNSALSPPAPPSSHWIASAGRSHFRRRYGRYFSPEFDSTWLGLLRELITARTVSAFRRLLCCAIVSSVLVTITACAPALRPLKGEPAPSVVPRAVLPAGYHQIVFDWELQDREMVGRGEGVARIASPDSVRLDLFLGGGFGSGVAVLIDDSLQVPRGSIVRGLIPPAPLLWAALGRASVPAF